MSMFGLLVGGSGRTPCPELWREDLENDLPGELDLFRQDDAAHAAATELALDPIAAAQGGLEALL
jgi:hypothetical protein